MKIIATIFSKNLVTNSNFIPFLSVCRIQKQESSFRQIDGMVMRNIFIFCLLRIKLYFKGMPSSINVYKSVFLDVISTHIIVPC